MAFVRRPNHFISKLTGFLSVILPSTLVLAQVQTPVTCNQVLPGVDKSAAACAGIGDNQTCYGNGVVTATFQASASSTQGGFAKVGDAVSLNTLQTLTTSPLDLTQNQWGVAVTNVGIADSNSASQGTVGPAVTLIQYGAATLSIANPPPSASVALTGTPAVCLTPLKADSLLRSAPSGGKVVKTLLNGTKVALDGRLADSSWIFVDSGGKSGWLQASSLGALSGLCGISQLPVIDPSVAAIMPALSSFSFSVGDAPDVLCRDLPTGGLLLQSPACRKVKFSVDGAQLTLDSAIVVLIASANQSLDIAVIDGQASVTASNSSIDIPTGKQVSVPLGGNAGLEVIGAPGKLAAVQPFNGDSGIYLKTLCELTADVNLQIPCTLTGNASPTTIPSQVNTPKPVIP